MSDTNASPQPAEQTSGKKRTRIEGILFSDPYNPCPETASPGYLQTDDGFRLRYAKWQAERFPCKGTVILLQGRSEFIEKHYETIQDLREAGFEVLTFDWRGQGGSERLLRDKNRGYVDSFDQYLMDIEAVMQQIALPDCKAPYFFLGHSTGSLTALLGASLFANRIRRMVLLSPLLGFGDIKHSTGRIQMISGFLNVIGLGEMYLAGNKKPMALQPFAGNKVSSDTERYQRTVRLLEEHPELGIGGPTAAWLHAACKAIEQVQDPEFHSLITTPILMISGSNDQVVSNLATEELALRLRSGSNLTIAGAKHELLQERDIVREQALAAFKSFIPGTVEEEAKTARKLTKATPENPAAAA